MIKISRSKQILSEIELLLDAGNYEDAKVLLSFLDAHRLDHESWLHLLLINVRLDGAIPYKDEIDGLRSLLDPSDVEKEIIRKIFLLASKSAEEGRRDQRRADPVNQTPEAARNALENRFTQTIRSLENQVSEKEKFLESREANIKALGYRVNQLNRQLAELRRAKDEDGRLFLEEIAQKGELLRLRDSAIKILEERFTKQIRVLEYQLGDEQNLLEIRDRELDSLMGKVSELIQERADLASEREKSDRLLQEALREKAALLHTKESSTRVVEKLRTKMPLFEG